LPLPRALGIDPRWGVAGLTISAGIASWIEFTLLRRTLNQRIGVTGIAKSYLARLWGAALAAAAAGWFVHHILLVHNFYQHHSSVLAAVFILAPYGLIYFGGYADDGLRRGADALRIADRLGRCRESKTAGLNATL